MNLCVFPCHCLWVYLCVYVYMHLYMYICFGGICLSLPLYLALAVVSVPLSFTWPLLDIQSLNIS